MKKPEIKNLENFVKKIIKQKPNNLKQPTNPPSLKEQSKPFLYNKKSGLVEEVKL